MSGVGVHGKIEIRAAQSLRQRTDRSYEHHLDEHLELAPAALGNLERLLW